MQAALLVVMITAQAPPPESSPPAPVAPAGFTVTNWAQHPLIFDPVTICFDPAGHMYVAETQRQERGVEDNRSSTFWLIDDLAARTVDDRRAYMEKWAHKRDGGMAFYSRFTDDIFRLSDTNGDGVADERTHFAGPFDDPVEGTGAGLLEVDGDIWFTCIPKVWRLRDADGDGLAEHQTVLHDGFGVRFALRGHDMHGLVKGPDGRVYWSVGDRGYHIEGPDGHVLTDPHSGAVFRCEPDGSGLEVFYTGLRNPQELAFDRYGRLFTGDNNSDSEDRARVVYLMEGGQTGWDMAYQTLEGDNERGPWVQEGVWKTDHDGRPAWALPPLSYIGSGPSGLTYLPGTGMPDRYDDRFLMCDFLGSPQHSSVLAFGVEPRGAGFEVVDIHPFVTGVLCTDVEMSWDGVIYVSDWVEGWGSTETGRIWRVAHESLAQDAPSPRAQDVARWDLSTRDLTELIDLLSHDDMRIRTRAHWELANRGPDAINSLAATTHGDDQLARLHALWALGIIDRRFDVGDAAMNFVHSVSWDDDAIIRTAAARLLGDAKYQPAYEDLLSLAFDDNDQVAAQAIMSLGKIGGDDGIDAAAEVLWGNADEDPFLRHACVFALAEIGNRTRLIELLGDAQSSVRLGAVLALRRMRDPAVSLALRDPDPFIAAEAARAIHDEEIESAMDLLADVADGLTVPDTREGRSFGRRAVEAASRRGDANDALALARIATNEANASIVRLEAARALREWSSPGSRDRVTGRYRAIPPRDPAVAATAVAALLPRLATAPGPLGDTGRAAATALGVSIDPSTVFDMMRDERQPIDTRVDCLHFLIDDHARSDEAIQYAMGSGVSPLQAVAMQRFMPASSRIRLARSVLDTDDPVLHRAAFRVLAAQEGPAALAGLDAMATPETRLDLLEARAPGTTSADMWAAAIAGGDVRRGRWLVENHSSAACIRCHTVDGSGGSAGPSLEGVAARLSRTELLTSIIDPQAVVAEGYGSVSAMPDMRVTLTPHEVRDIVAYLATCQEIAQ